MSYVINWLLVFFAMFLTDILFGLYVRRASQGAALQAATYGSLILACSGFVTVSYVGTHSMIVAAMLGAFVGTYLVIKLDKRDV